MSNASSMDRLSTWLQTRMVGLNPVLFWKLQSFIRHLEPELALVPKLCQLDKSMVDVGLHTGMYLSTALPHSRAGIGFEPRLAMAATMQRAFRGRAVTIYGVALSNRCGTTTIRVPRLRPTRSTLATDNHLLDVKGCIDEVEVEVRTLDSYGLSEVGLIKIDTEGHEPEVIEGSLQTLRTCRPALILEAEERHRSRIVGDICAMLAPLNYRGFFMRNGHVHPIKDFDPQRDQRADSHAACVRNFVFVQEEAADHLRSSALTT